MKYIIDLTMLYEVDTGIIMINGEEESSVKLSNQAGRLLYELITNNGKTLDRDELIKKVWDDHGFSGSSVSLNVAISEIRKVFRTLGGDPLLIKTIRGKGFSFAGYIEHHTVRPPVVLSLSEQSIPKEPDILLHKKDQYPPKRIITVHMLFILLCMLLLIFILAATVFFFTKENPSYSDSVNVSDCVFRPKPTQGETIDSDLILPRIPARFGHPSESVIGLPESAILSSESRSFHF